MNFPYILPNSPKKPFNEKLMLFYSFPDYSGNSLALFEYVRKNTKYQTIFAIKDKETAKKLKESGVPCFWIFDRKEGHKWFSSAKYIITTHEYDNAYPKYQGQVYVALGHSLSISFDQFGNTSWDKIALRYIKWKSTMADLHFVTSDLTKLLDSSTWFYDARKAIVTGEPRCDLIFAEDGKRNLNKLYSGISKKYKKFIIYAPSSRESFGFNIGKGFKNNIFNFEHFNKKSFGDFLKKEKACVFYRFHPNDEENGIEKDITIPPHFFSLNSKILSENSVSLYHLLNAFDVMIDDTSSLTFEYLLLDRPVIRIFEDMDELIKAFNPGLGNPDFWYPGERVKNQKALEKAISTAIKNPQKGSKERSAVRKLLFSYCDGNACSRVLDAIENYKPIENIEYEMYTEEPLIRLNAVSLKLEEENKNLKKEKEHNKQKTIEIEKLSSDIVKIQNIVNKKNKEISSINKELLSHKHDNEVLNKELLLHKYDNEVLNNVLKNIYSSKSWKLASKFSSVFRFLFPLNSKRRLFAKLAYKFFCHPFKFLSKLTPKRIVSFFNILRREGVVGASQRVNNTFSNINALHYTQKIDLIKKNTNNKKISDYKPIIFKKVSSPLVSIIIPVFNEFDFTYNCLKSIFDHSGNLISYEIIIADDCSTDITKQIKKVIQNINVITNTVNLRFLKNCNNAAKNAKGKYILFLNNDTQVQENWLLPLVELMEKDHSIGAVGSKLVYENITLQEAGGIYWNDASAWNYGRFNDPALPEYNYVREVDYISGAALMIRMDIWKNLGGFDEQFSPAYCEDADICFSIRKLGYKVMYQPASVVVHFEGVSNGTDLSEGQKQFQTVNQGKFFEKWKDTLEKEHFINGENVFFARDRSRNKKTLLFVDHYVPHFDKDAGSRAAFQFLNVLVDKGFNIKFIGDNFFRHEPYTAILQQIGIEVLYGDYYFLNWKTWLIDNGKYFDFVILSRPHISERYIDIIKKHSNAKIFYYGHDLHFLRESREYLLTKNKDKLKSSEKWKKAELSLMKKSDVVYYFSTAEIEIIKKLDPKINCKVIPLNVFPKVNLKTWDNTRKNLVFVGGFGHVPNIDSIFWFVNNVMPLILESNPEIILYVIGSNVTDEIQKLNGNNIKILGFVDDSTLDDYYNKCRICIAPLRFGAGVKGKVLEAMFKQIPVITTTIGAEGIPDAEDCMIIEDEPNKFAEKLINMYNDDEILEKLTESSYHYIMKNFTSDRINSILDEDFIGGENGINY